MTHKELFEKLVQLDVNEFTEVKKDLTYLSWAHAWREFLKIVPDATYKVKMFAMADGTLRPYCGDGKIGYMVFTEITANGLTRECYLPVMDNNNKTMKDEPYTYVVKSGEKSVEAVSMFDVNKAIMRCLAKNIAMFGMGLYIYTGEDLPSVIEEPITNEQIETMEALDVIIPNVLKKFKVQKVEELTFSQAQFVIDQKKKSIVGAQK